MPTAQPAPTSPLSIATLICHDHVAMGLECLSSLKEHCKDSFQLIIFEDGSLTKADRARLGETLNPTQIVSREEADDSVLPRLSAYPSCRWYRNAHPLGIKLIDIPLMLGRPYVYCDSDILFVRDFVGLDRRRSHEPVVFMLDEKDGYCLNFHIRYIHKDKFPHPDRVNAGLMYVGKAAYDLDFVEWFLSKEEFHLRDFLVEQTCWAGLCGRTDSFYWDPVQIAIPPPYGRATPHATALHFTGPTRHLLGQGQQVLYRKGDGSPAASDEAELVQVRTQSSFRTGLLAAVLKRAKRRMPLLR